MSALVVCLSASGNELSDFLLTAERNNPQLQAAHYQVNQAVASQEGVEGANDTDVYAGIGGARDIVSIPAGKDYEPVGGDVLKLEGGATIPVESLGSYVSIGGAMKRVFDGGDYDDYYQASGGIRIEVPLLRDRGFALLDYRRAIALAEFNYALGNYAIIAQALRHDIEQAYISAYESVKACENAEEATARFVKFQNDAAKMVELQAIAEYQLCNAELELQLGREDEAIAENGLKTKLLALANLVCPEGNIVLSEPADCLIDEAKALAELPVLSGDMAFAHRGEVLVLMAELDAARAQLDMLEEDGKDQLGIDAGVSWNGEGKSSPFEMRRLTGENHVGFEALLVWRRTLGKRGNEADKKRILALIEEKKASLQSTRNQLLMQLRTAENNYEAAHHRFEILNQGVDAARKTVEAERKRFNQGEGTSKDVLDAQKKLTDILQRLNTAAADMLRAESDFRYATGYDLKP